MITSHPTIDTQLSANAVVAFAVSGGKDGAIAALAGNEYLNKIGHRGERVLIHADLGSVEWKDSLPMCEKLSEHLNIPLIVVQRKAGGMMQRWLTRWENNVKRYIELSCVKLILPWSTPSMRFCTSELKTAIICRELAQRFKGKTIINVTGVRRDESASRKNTPIYKVNNLLARKDGTKGFDWQAIVEMKTEDIFIAHRHFDFPLHSAYTTYGASRVSCVFCIMSKAADLVAASECEDNFEIYREMCELEIVSAFSFQSNKWLLDVAPHLLTAEMLKRLARAKEIQIERENLEKQIPKHLLYSNNFPEAIPNLEEAKIISGVRKAVGRLQGFEMKVTEPIEIIGRYKDLMEEKLRRQAMKNKALII